VQNKVLRRIVTLAGAVAASASIISLPAVANAATPDCNLSKCLALENQPTGGVKVYSWRIAATGQCLTGAQPGKTGFWKNVYPLSPDGIPWPVINAFGADNCKGSSLLGHAGGTYRVAGKYIIGKVTNINNI
jgi:hypothetical protein